MRILLQRVSSAQVDVNGQTIGAIGPGLLLLLGIGPEDTQAICDAMVEKCCNLRIFEDDAGKMNLSLIDKRHETLVVSQFTLYANCRKGRRPSFTDAAPPDHANELYEYTCHSLRQRGVTVATGRFGADMKVNLTNDGPVTIWLDSEEVLPT